MGSTKDILIAPIDGDTVSVGLIRRYHYSGKVAGANVGVTWRLAGS